VRAALPFPLFCQRRAARQTRTVLRQTLPHFFRRRDFGRVFSPQRRFCSFIVAAIERHFFAAFLSTASRLYYCTGGAARRVLALLPALFSGTSPGTHTPAGVLAFADGHGFWLFSLSRRAKLFPCTNMSS
jgi:hypothetical protein